MSDFMDKLATDLEAHIAELRGELVLCENALNELRKRTRDKPTRRATAKDLQARAMDALSRDETMGEGGVAQQQRGDAAVPRRTPKRTHPPVTQPPEGSSAKLGDLLGAGLGFDEAEITDEQARDVFVGMTGEFTRQVLMDAYDISATTATTYMERFCERGIIRHVRGRAATARYEYVPVPAGGPTTKPRGERLLEAPRRNGGSPVPGTGKSRADTSVTGQRRPGRR